MNITLGISVSFRRCLITFVVLSLALCLGIANAQSTTHTSLAPQGTTGELAGRDFAAASVRPSSSKDLGYRLRTSAGRLTVVGITAKELVEYAYDLKPFQVRGGLGWTSEDKFDITAVMDESLAASESKEQDYDRQTAQIRLMTQNLLAKRFGLVAHKETVSSLVYELSMAKPITATNHPGLQPFIPGVPSQASDAGLPGAYNVTMTNVPLSTLARRVSDYLKSPVIDKTNLSGVFNINLSWYDPLDENPTSAATSDLPESLKTRLDMQLIRTKGTTDILVIDRLDSPTSN
jgi:uncharacterized protein (TIGR03435 family)